jgi:hypothetical protein
LILFTSFSQALKKKQPAKKAEMNFILYRIISFIYKKKRGLINNNAYTKKNFLY